MFGNPDWFREKQIGWGIVPIAWQGWRYVALWTLVMACPFAALLAFQLAPESLIWLALSMSALLLDVRQILKSKRRSLDNAGDVLYIGDEESDDERLATRHFDLSLRP